MEKERPDNLISMVESREHINIDSFMQDVNLFQQIINTVDYPDLDQIKLEVSEWDFSTPDKDFVDIERVLQTYSRVYAYRTRFSEIMSEASIYQMYISTAYKSLKETAHALFSGTAKERDANSNFRLRGFEIEMLYADSVIIFLKEVNHNLQDIFFNLNVNAKYLETLSRVNSGYDRKGIESIRSDYDAEERM